MYMHTQQLYTFRFTGESFASTRQRRSREIVGSKTIFWIRSRCIPILVMNEYGKETIHIYLLKIGRKERVMDII